MREAETTLESATAARQRFEDEVVDAERAFAIRVAYDGIREGFLSVLAEDSVICGEGPEPGRPAYEAMPQGHTGSLMWEPAVAAASPDGTLAFTSGPYRRLDPAGHEKSNGVYFSVWRRHASSGHLEVVLDFGAKGAEFPDAATLPSVTEGAGSLEAPMQAWVQEGRIPPTAGALRLGDETSTGTLSSKGYFLSGDQRFGILWGSRARSDGGTGAFAIVMGQGATGPVPVAYLQA